ILISNDFTMLLDENGSPINGEAVGEVRFKSDDTTAEAHRATFDAVNPAEQIVLHATARRRARLARGRSRIAAERITTNARGTHLAADGRVESSLLAGEGVGSRRAGLFRNDEAIHFVSEHLEGDPSTNALVFTGSVRGWQGDRNLAADRVEVDQTQDRLDAAGNVMTRLPRVENVTRSSGDFIQVGSERLRYRGLEGEAVFEGDVRVRFLEGWLDSETLDVTLTERDRAVEEILASGEVRFEFASPGSGTGDSPVTGEGDRVRYLPAERTVTLYGDQAPAVVRRQNIEGGVTRGRVLRYHLDTGDLAVESGDRDRATIQTANP
ncbi:MAG: LptA/OstA family protein, partial [Acidobacteriota bacterium]|nr:LptA/OstA family protein [Acidobacteriota bacterium]